MSKTIFYIVNPDTHEFFFYDNLDGVKKKEEELAQIFGYSEIFKDAPKVYRQFKTLKNYYGTVWLCIKKNGCYIIHSRWKDAKENIQYGYKVIKFELSPFEKASGAKEKSYWLESNKQTMVKRRSPGFD